MSSDFNPDWATYPGLILEEEIIARGIDIYEFANEMATTYNIDIMAILSDKLAITEDIAKELEKHLGISDTFWLNLQKNYDDYQLSLNNNKST